jgi:DHA1 family multidrug resistance protein-like MFS transporter
VTLESIAAVLGALLGSVLLALDFYWVAMGGCAIFVAAALANTMLLPAYRVAAPGIGAWAALRTPLADRPYLRLVLTLSGYYVLYVQLMLLLPQQVVQITGTTRAIVWTYSMEAVLALLMLFVLTRLREGGMNAPFRFQLGLGMMAISLLLIPTATTITPLFAALLLFYIGMLVAEPAREALVAQHAHPKARASYIGLSRIGLAVGGMIGYTAGGYLLDSARVLNMPALPWQVLASVGAVTLYGVARLGREATMRCGGAAI